MEAQRYYQALKEGNPSLLEELAQEAGYTKRFIPLNSKFNRILSPAYIYDGRGFILESPRQYWNERYKDIFTLLKRTNDGVYFVDCWKPATPKRVSWKRHQLGFINGKFSEIRAHQGDEETNIISNLDALRRKYPPLSRLELFTGPDQEWIFYRVLIDSAAGLVAYLLTQRGLGMNNAGIYMTLAAIALSEFSVHQVFIYNLEGEGYFRGNNKKIGKRAIDSLITEAKLVG